MTPQDHATNRRGGGGHRERGHGHGHDEYGPNPQDPAEDPLWESDHIELTSVGIDVGSATAQVLFSRLVLHRMGRQLSSRYVVVSREILYRSPVSLTPYSNGLRIDEHALDRVVGDAFTHAGLDRHSVDTGAIILTGEAMRRENAKAIAQVLAAESGSFVCAAAGHHMEANLAAHGSGAVALSRQEHSRVLNIDIGGGTTKFAVVDSGEVVQTAALHVGARLAAFDDDGRLARLEPAGAEIAARAGVDWELGSQSSQREIAHVTGWMARAVVGAASGAQDPDGVVDLLLTDGLPAGVAYDAVIFSGGVSEYVHGGEGRSFGDLGLAFGRALARQTAALPGPVSPTSGGIRATVLGASQYTVQVSGNTIYVSNPDVLPLHNLQVVYPKTDLSGPVDSAEVAQSITRHLEKLEVEVTGNLAFAFSWAGAPSFARLDALVRGIEIALARRISEGLPLCLLFEGDIGRTIGALLKEERGYANTVISIDGVSVTDFEFIDIGAVLIKSGTVPISIKSLLFEL